MRLRTMTIAALLATGIAACGSDDEQPTTAASDAAGTSTAAVDIEGVGAVSVDEQVAAALPTDFADRGKVVVATNAPYEPFIDFKTEGAKDEFKGLDYDLALAASAKLGVRAEFLQQPFDGLIPGLQAGKYDAIVGGITDNEERQEVATFVDYSASGTGFLVKPGNPDGVASAAELCGKTVAVQKASNQQEHLETYSKDSCGANAITVKPYPENPQAVQAMLAGNAEAVAATKVALVEIAKELEGQVELVENPEEPNGWLASPNGFGFLRSNGVELAKAYQSAIQSLVDDGTYGKILAKYGQEPIGIEEITMDKAVD